MSTAISSLISTVRFNRRGGSRGRPAEHGDAPPGGPASAVSLTTEQLIYRGRAEGRLMAESLEPT